MIETKYFEIFESTFLINVCIILCDYQIEDHSVTWSNVHY